jgi:hypothetical protein
MLFMYQKAQVLTRRQYQNTACAKSRVLFGCS